MNYFLINEYISFFKYDEKIYLMNLNFRYPLLHMLQMYANFFLEKKNVYSKNL